MNTTLGRRRHLSLASLALVAVSFLGLYSDVITKMVRDWSTNENYSHGFLIPVISGVLVWIHRSRISAVPVRPSNLGLFVLCAGLFLFLLGNLGAELFTMRISMVVVLFGLSAFLWGHEITKLLLWPLGYLIFMIPLPTIIWNKVAFPLRLFATNVSALVIQSFGISVYCEGNILHLSGASLEVVDACSGLRSLTSLLALSAALALLTNCSRTRKILVFLSAVPIAIIINIIRLTITAVLAERVGERAAQGFLHEGSGIFVFGLGLVLLYSVNTLLGRMASPAESRD